ncbi:Early nodulin-like protein [Thalictrum thalictroides]|uniref:Early nodulin-like protein n=1 Tax=Thalictrum thalictroides TaxID=46969 RepID=A0A7J6WIV7_THATH|nr:Early nodulin-like protein [Thalictrum thalictroides]
MSSPPITIVPAATPQPSDKKKSNRRGLKICLGVTVLLLLIFIVVVVILIFTVFKPKQPQIIPQPVNLTHVEYEVFPVVKINASALLMVTINNRNYGSFTYKNTTAYIQYHGEVVGSVPMIGGTIPSRAKHNISSLVNIDGNKLIASPYLIPDFNTGRMNFSSVTSLRGDEGRKNIKKKQKLKASFIATVCKNSCKESYKYLISEPFHVIYNQSEIPKFWLKPPILSAPVSLVLEQMANNILSFNHPNKALYALVLFGVVLLMQRVGATEFKVGDANGWTVQNDHNKWATEQRFKIGDSLLFVYPPANDSVLEVNENDYENCNTASPIASFNDGNTIVKFNHSGPHFFISGIKDNCLRDEKIHVIVMADRSNKSPNTNQAPLASPPPPPATPPPSGSIPAPAPAGDDCPSPPPPPNGASSTFLSVFGSFGAFVGSSLLLAL